MGTNLHKIRFPSSARSRRIKTLLDLRKLKRSQVFRSHRLRHFLAQDDRIRQQFRAISHHLDLISDYSDEQKLTALLLIMVGKTPQISDFICTELAAELMKQMNEELQTLATSICYVVSEIDANYLIEQRHSIGARFEHDNLTIRLNVNSISDLMVELLSLLPQNFSSRCHTSNILVSRDILYMLEMCFQRYGHNHRIIERNLNTMLTLTQGVGRFERTRAMVEYAPLMQRLVNYQTTDYNASVIILKIINSMTNGFAENIEYLLRFNLLGHLKHQLTNLNHQSHDVAEQCLRILDNICGNHRSDIQAVIEADLISPLMNAFTTDDDINLRKIACNILYSISSLGSIEQIKVLFGHGLLRQLCYQLHYHTNFDEETFETVLEILNNILRDFYRRDHSTYHQVCATINEWGGFGVIDQLLNHSSESISNIALQLNQYSGSTCARCIQSTFNPINERMQQ